MSITTNRKMTSKYDTQDFYRQFLCSLKIGLIKIRKLKAQVQSAKVLENLNLREKFLRADIALLNSLIIKTRKIGDD